MLNKVKPYLLLILLISSYLNFGIGKTGASDATLSCGDSGCSAIGGAIFNETNITPGALIAKTLTATNNYSQARSFAVEVSGSSFSDSSPSLADELSVTIKDNSDAAVLYGPKTLSHWKNDGFVNLASIDPGASKEFLFEVNFSDVGNDFQGLSMSFDLNFGFEEVEESTQTSSSNQGTSNSSSTSSSGQVLGVSTGNSIGNVLGLSATGMGILVLLIFLIGVILALFGAIILIKSLKTSTSD